MPTVRIHNTKRIGSWSPQSHTYNIVAMEMPISVTLLLIIMLYLRRRPSSLNRSDDYCRYFLGTGPRVAGDSDGRFREIFLAWKFHWNFRIEIFQKLDGQGKARRDPARRRNSECKINFNSRNSSRSNGSRPTAVQRAVIGRRRGAEGDSIWAL